MLPKMVKWPVVTYTQNVMVSRVTQNAEMASDKEHLHKAQNTHDIQQKICTLCLS